MAEQLTRRDLLKRGGLGAVAAATLAAAPALAQEPVALTEEEPASFRASSWARSNEGIAIAVVLGNNTGLEPDALVANFKNGFKQAFNVDAEVFIDTADRNGAIVAYYYGEHATNPEPFQTGTTMERMQFIVDQYKSPDTAQLGNTVSQGPSGAG